MSPYNTDAARWRALVSRDPDSNGHFIYSVKSTQIYCRPVCPGRLARRANVDFYKNSIEAEKAGFRACKRCKPDAVQEEPQKRAVEKACLLIEAAAKKGDSKALRLRDLAKKVGLTPRYFHKIFKNNTGLTPKDYSDTKILEQSGPGIASSLSVKTWGTDWDTLIDWWAGPSTALIDDFGIDKAGFEFGTDGDLNELLHSWNSGCDFTSIDLNIPFPTGSALGPPEARAVPLPIIGKADNDQPAAFTFEVNAATSRHVDDLTGLTAT